jgi:S-(hydroxymethyl)glutathione dehydrogenase/alcohol dehydrogenase
MGATDFVNPRNVEEIVPHLMKLTGSGADYSFECIGNPQVMRTALECTDPAWGIAYILGVAAHGAEATMLPGSLFMGRRWTGAYMGGARVGRLPEIVDWYMQGKINLDRLITHRLTLDQIGTGFELMQKGQSIRSVVLF